MIDGRISAVGGSGTNDDWELKHVTFVLLGLSNLGFRNAKFVHKILEVIVSQRLIHDTFSFHAQDSTQQRILFGQLSVILLAISTLGIKNVPIYHELFGIASCKIMHVRTNHDTINRMLTTHTTLKRIT